MDKVVLDYVVEYSHKLIGAETCSAEAKAAAQSWLDAIGTDTEAAETKRYLAELEADLVTIENLILFSESERGIQLFGADMAKDIATHAREIQAAGARYCDCPACAAALAIVEKKDALLS